MTKDEHIKYWLDGAAHDLDAAESLFSSGKFDWCLFLGHLVLEKTLKALIVAKTDIKPPKTHNLLKLVELVGLSLSEEQSVFFDEVNDFNLETRYPDYKNAFYRRCTKEFAEPYFSKIKETYQWLLSQIE